MNNDKKKVLTDKKNEITKSNTIKKKAPEKLKADEDIIDDQKSQAKMMKYKKVTTNTLLNISSATPKNSKQVCEKKLIQTKLRKGPSTTDQKNHSNQNSKLSVKGENPPSITTQNKKNSKKKSWNDNITVAINILNLFVQEQQNKLNDNLSYSLNKLGDLSKNIFFQNLHTIKKQTNDLIALIGQYQAQSRDASKSFDYNRIFLDFIESLMHKVEMQKDEDNILLNTNGNFYNDIKTEPSPQRSSTKHFDYSLQPEYTTVNLIQSKENSISFEIPIRPKRALSTRIEERLNRSRKTSEEIEKRMKEKIDTAEKKKMSIKQINIDNSNKIAEKISKIKQKQKNEKKEKIKKLYTKLEKMNNQQQKIMKDKIDILKKEHEKVAEINYLHSLEKENRNLNILKKLDISIERRNKYIQERVNKTLRNDKYYSFSLNSSNPNNNNNNTISECLKDSLISKIDQSTSSGLEVFEKKRQIECRFDFLKKVFNENFIWELFEADYFNLDELYNLSSLTRFELLKAKLRKDKEIIDKLYDHPRQAIKSNTFYNTNSNWAETVSNEVDNYNYNINEDDLFASDIELNKSKNYAEKRSKSFTVFNEEDFLDINYLFINDNKKKKNRKKKKRNKVTKDKKIINKEQDATIRHRLLRSFNSLSQTDLRVFYEQTSKEPKIKRYLVKSRSNGKYVNSKLIITNENLNSYTNIKTVSPKEKVNTNLTTPKKEQQGKSPKDSMEFQISNVQSKINNSNHTNKDKDSKEGISDQEKENNEKKEKIFHGLIQASDLGSNNNTSNTILISSDSIVNLLEKNQITVRWCKICNMILPNDQDSNVHINKSEHQRIKKEYGLSLQEESNTIMLFQSIPGDINEELKSERVNAIKIRVKKLKQKMMLKMVKHENFGNYKQDFPSPNKQRIQKLSFDIDKQVYPNIKDYDSLENLLKDLIKILDQKKQNDLHFLRQVKVIFTLVEVLKKPAVCHKSEIKSLGKIMELIIKILSFFSSILENRNYMIVTNRISVIADLLLWVLNKPSKIPLGISFLPDLISIIIIHIKHRIPFEYLSMKDDTLEYLIVSNILLKFKQKYYNLTGPTELTSGFGSFPSVLLKSLSMFESLTFQININYLTKPVYVKHTKMSENILFMFEYSELIGMVHFLSVLLLSNGPIKPKEKITVQPKTVISASLIAVKIINNICRIDLNLVQSIVSNSFNQEKMQHVITFIITYSYEFLESSDELKELLHELLLLIGYLSLNNEKFQNVVSRGEFTIIQNACKLPFTYFSDKQLKDVLFPTLIAMTYKNERNTQILSQEINLEFVVLYLKEKIQLEPILEEEIDDMSSSINNDCNAHNLIKINKEQFLQGNNEKSDIKPRGVAYSTASSTKSCHDMVTGISDFLLLYHRFPFDLWEKAVEYYSNFGKSK